MIPMLLCFFPWSKSSSHDLGSPCIFFFGAVGSLLKHFVSLFWEGQLLLLWFRSSQTEFPGSELLIFSPSSAIHGNLWKDTWLPHVK